MTTEQTIEQLFEELVNKPSYYHWQQIPTRKRKAVKTITAMGLPVIECLIQYYDDSSARKSNYAKIIVKEVFREFGDDAVTYLLNLLHTENVETKLQVIEVLRNEGFAKVIANIRQGSNLRTSPKSSHFYDDARVIEALISLLNDQSETVRISAVNALQWFEDTRSIEPLIEFLGDENEVMRIATARTLGRIRNNKTTESLLKLLADESKDVRVAAAQELSRIKDRKSIEPLLDHLLDENEDIDVRLASASALASMKEKRATDQLLDFLEHQDWKVRFEAAGTLGYLEDPRALPCLRTHLTDRSKRVRKSVKRALLRFDMNRRQEKAT